jgi:hypothetical protein
MKNPRLPARCAIFVLAVLAAAGGGVSAQTLTTPEQFLGFRPGADYHLATYEQAVGYLEKLAAESPRLKVFDLGPTPMGRRMKYAVVSSAANISDLDRLRDISRRLSLVRDVSGEEAQRLAETGKAVVWVDGGLHATECAPAQHLIQLAYDLVAGEDAQTRAIRDNVITLIVFPNPDGMTLVAEWYGRNLKTEFETSAMPWVYNKYAGHDNNRDCLYANLPETQYLMQLQCREWFPTVLLNHHQTAPFPSRIFIPPFAEPTNVDVHPLLWREQNMIGSAMGLAFDAAGQPGAISRIAFDGYYPGYCTAVTDGHNCPSILTEIALYRYATPREYKITDFPEAYRDLTPGRFYPSPWKPGWWRLGDAVSYALTASKAVLDVATRYRVEFLLNKYTMGHDAIELGQTQSPFGWIIVPDQLDPGLTAAMLNKLILLGTEVYRAGQPFSDGGRTYPPGTYFIPAGQAFGSFVKQMFKLQDYPDLRKYPHLWQNAVGDPVKSEDPLRPYDASGWTLPLQFGVATAEMSKPLDIPATLVSNVELPPGRVAGRGTRFVIDARETRSITAVAAILAAGGHVGRALQEITFDGKTWPRGTFIAEGLGAGKLSGIAVASGATFNAVRGAVKTAPVRAPRIGIYKSWTANADEGWIRLIFDEHRVPYRTLTDADVRAGSLEKTADVIILPEQAGESIVRGNRAGSMPAEFTGGIGEEGVDALRAFVRGGGRLVCNGAACQLPISRFKLPVADVVRGFKLSEFYISGSILKMDFDPGQSLAYGMPVRGVAFYSRSLVFDIKPEAEPGVGTPVVVAKYPHEPLLLSGWLQGDEKIRGRAAVVEVPFGRGRVILFGFNIVNRWQTPSVVKMLFNAAY